jgi:N6-adenosine-specific RNA methylase IME4
VSPHPTRGLAALFFGEVTVTDLIKLDGVKQFLMQATDLRELLDVQRKVDAGMLYARRSGLHDAQNELAEAKIRIDRRIGQIISELPKSVGGRPSKNSSQADNSLSETSSQPDKKLKGDTLKELNIPIPTANRLEQSASVTDEQFEEYVSKSKATGQEITASGILRFAQKQHHHEPVIPPPLPDGAFDVIYADPPWFYDFAPHSNINIENHYPTMQTDDICAMEIPAAKNAVLFLWATSPKLLEALRVMDAWGFTYKTHAVWDKESPTSLSMGYWFRGQHELLLVGTKGQISPPQSENRFVSVIREKKTRHSKKPDCAYTMIETMMPGRQYLELFARNERDNWQSWGNQA